MKTHLIILSKSIAAASPIHRINTVTLDGAEGLVLLCLPLSKCSKGGNILKATDNE